MTSISKHLQVPTFERNAAAAVPAENNWLAALATVALALPSAMALLCADAISQGLTWFPASSMWFMYQASRYVAYLGIAASAGIVVTLVAQHKTSRNCIVVTACSLVANVLLLWAAIHLFNNLPWQ